MSGAEFLGYHVTGAVPAGTKHQGDLLQPGWCEWLCPALFSLFWGQEVTFTQGQEPHTGFCYGDFMAGETKQSLSNP